VLSIVSWRPTLRAEGGGGKKGGRGGYTSSYFRRHGTYSGGKRRGKGDHPFNIVAVRLVQRGE